MRQSQWTPERNAELARMWQDKTISSTEIGRYLGITKNAVIGRANRMGLPPRCKLNQPEQDNNGLTIGNISDHQCRWPIGDPKDENFHFCGDTSLPDKSYCIRHQKIAYRRTPKPKFHRQLQTDIRRPDRRARAEVDAPRPETAADAVKVSEFIQKRGVRRGNVTSVGTVTAISNA